MCVIVLFLIFARLNWASVLSTRVTPLSTYTSSLIDPIGVKYDSIVVSTTFDKNMYWQSFCSETDPVSLAVCSNNDPLCIDGRIEDNFINITNTQITLRGNIANYDSCDGALVLSIKLGKLISLVSFKANNFSHVIYNVVEPTKGIRPLAVCCQDLRQSGWNGSFTMTIQVTGFPSSVSVLVPEVNAIAVTKYPQLVETTVICNELPLSCLDGCPINIETTTDPLYSYWTSQLINIVGNIDINSLDPVDNTLSTLIWITKHTSNTLAPSGLFGVGNNTIFNFADCRVHYSGIKNQIRTPSSSFGNAYSSSCMHSEFSFYANSYQSVVNYLINYVDTLSTSQTYSLLDLASAMASSLGWNNCLSLAHSFLTPDLHVSTIFTKECLLSDSDPNYVTDPCCNVQLQNYQCCRSKPYNVSYTTYHLEDLSDVQTCSSPNCIIQPLLNLQELSEANSNCEEPRMKVIEDPTFSINGVQLLVACKATVFGNVSCFQDAECINTIGAHSYCDRSLLHCVVRCTNSCYNGQCIDGTCRDLSNIHEDVIVGVLDCVLDKLDPYIAVILKNDIESSSNIGSLAEKFERLITKDTCITHFGGETIIGNELYTKEQCDAFPGYCIISGGLFGTVDPLGKLLDLAQCYKYTMYQTQGLCVLTSTVHKAFTLSRPNICSVRLEDANMPILYFAEAICLSAGGEIFLGPGGASWRPYGPCGILNLTESECYNKAGICLGNQYKNVPCHSYCKMVNQSSITCNGTTAQGYLRNWYFFPNTIQGVCVVEAPDFGACTGAGNSYVFGREYLPEQYNTPDSCPKEICLGSRDGTGFKSPDTTVEECLKPTCSSCVYGTEPECFSQEICESTYSCDAMWGCKLSHTFGAAFKGIWNPELSVFSYDIEACAVLQVVRITQGWQNSATLPNQTFCEQATVQMCNDGGLLPDGSFRIFPRQPPGYSYKNKTECEACEGHLESWYNWKPSRWLSNKDIVHPFWVDNLLDLAEFSPILSPTRFSVILEKARTARLNSIFVAELYCKYGTSSSLLESISCACDDNSSTRSCDSLTQLSGSPVGVLSICQGIDSETTLFNTTFIANNITLLGLGRVCTNVYIFIVPSNQFEFKQSGITSSLAIISETEIARLSSTYVYNHENVVVGQILGNGMTINFEDDFNRTLSGFSICMELPSYNKDRWSLRQSMYYWDIGFVTHMDESFTFIPLGLNADSNATRLCTSVDVSSAGTYFPIGLVKDWETETIEQSWTTSEKGLMIFVIIMFLILLLWVLISLALRLVLNKTTTKDLRAESSLVFLATLSLLGVIYYAGKYQGHYFGNRLNPLFSDLPQLCLLSCIVIVGDSWRILSYKGRHLTDKMESNKISLLAPFIFLLSLYMIFVAIMIAVSTVNSEIEYTCATSESEKNELTAYMKLFISYKSIYAFYCAIIAIAFAFYGISVVTVLWKIKRLRETVTKCLIATIVATLALFITVAVSLYSVQNTLSNTTKLAFTIGIEILPGYALAYLFSFKSNFTEILHKLSTSVKGSESSDNSTGKTSNTSIKTN